MLRVSAQFPAELAEELDEASRRLNCTRAELIRQAVEHYLDDLEDLRMGLERRQDPADPVLEWEEVRRGLLDQDEEERGQAAAVTQSQRADGAGGQDRPPA
jgi:transposase